MPPDRQAFANVVAAKALRKLRAERADAPAAWFGLGMLGVVGWSVTVPTLAGGLFGSWLDRHHPQGHSWTLALLVAGLVVGCANAWHWVTAQNAAMHLGSGSIDE